MQYNSAMNLRLSHYGWMRTRHLSKQKQLHLGDSPDGDLLLELFTGSHISTQDAPFYQGLVDQGLVEVIPEDIQKEST